ncbi:MAG: single-stranded DNA-binding protein, partial [Verrucomicrobiota bacterium]|nr:single-stranded DNA-binding protein [Verrucomicrobiota bacterium]
LMVEGRLKLDQWESPEGQKRSKLGVVLENFQFVGGRDDEDSSSSNYEQNSPPKRVTRSISEGDVPSGNDNFDDDVPF